jgi:hypothetical protein
VTIRTESRFKAFQFFTQVSFLLSTTMAMRYVHCACLTLPHTTVTRSRTCNTLGRIHGKAAAAATLPMLHNDAEIKGRYRPAFSILPPPPHAAVNRIARLKRVLDSESDKNRYEACQDIFGQFIHKIKIVDIVSNASAGNPAATAGTHELGPIEKGIEAAILQM